EKDGRVVESARRASLTCPRPYDRRELPDQAAKGRECGGAAHGDEGARREEDDAGEMRQDDAPVADVLPHQRREVLHEEAVDRRLAPQATGRAAVPVMDDAAGLEQRRPAALP